MFAAATFSQSGEDGPVGQFTDFTFSSPADQLENQWKVKGEKAVVNADGKIDIEKVKAELMSKSETYEIVAERGTIDKGVLDKENQVIRVEGNVTINTESGITIIADYLTYFAKTKEIKSEGPLKIQKKDFLLTGDGVYGSIGQGLLDVKRNIRIEIYENLLKEFSL